MSPRWLDARRGLLAEALAVDPSALPEGVRDAGGRGAYLALAVLSGVIPTEREVVDFARAMGTEPRPAWAAHLGRVRRSMLGRRPAEIAVVGGLVVDVTNTASSAFTTGIQRVAREVVAAWDSEDLTLVVWDAVGRLHAADPEQAARAGSARGGASAPVLVVPDRARLVLPEIAVDRQRAQRLASIAGFGARTSLAIGFDCIPVTTAETAGPGMPGAFSRYLAGLARFDRIAAISDAARAEFEGWGRMLPSAGLLPPQIATVELPITPIDVVPESESAVRGALGLGSRPVVLAVGSHEPRKNHLAVLTAAELAWRAGEDFTLVFVGGNAWNAEEFLAAQARLVAAGRSILLLSNAPDARLAGLVALARVSVFCSINEGYGLPVAEALAVGTPVITADFGSQRDIGEGTGAVLVDPKEPAAIAEALLSVLGDDALRDALIAETFRLRTSSWADYAAQLLRYLEG